MEKLAKSEERDNEVEFHRQMGKYVRYGQVVQFKHMMTQRNMRISSTEAAKLDVLNMSVDLDAAHSKRQNALRSPVISLSQEPLCLSLSRRLVQTHASLQGACRGRLGSHGRPGFD